MAPTAGREEKCQTLPWLPQVDQQPRAGQSGAVSLTCRSSFTEPPSYLSEIEVAHDLGLASSFDGESQATRVIDFLFNPNPIDNLDVEKSSMNMSWSMCAATLKISPVKVGQKIVRQAAAYMALQRLQRLVLEKSLASRLPRSQLMIVLEVAAYDQTP